MKQFFIWLLLASMMFYTIAELQGCKCEQIQVYADCIQEKLFCKWDNSTSKCSLKTCPERDTRELCRPQLQDIFASTAEVQTCYWNPKLQVCEDIAKLVDPCTNIDVSEIDVDEDGMGRYRACLDFQCNFDQNSDKCLDLTDDCVVEPFELCDRLFTGLNRKVDGQCTWDAPKPKEGGSCKKQQWHFPIVCEEQINFYFCFNYFQCVWMGEKCVSFKCEDLSGKVGRNYCEIQFQLDSVNGFQACKVSEKACESINPAELPEDKCQQRTFNTHYFDKKENLCKECDPSAKYIVPVHSIRLSVILITLSLVIF